MKKILSIVLLLLVTSAYAQKKVKLKHAHRELIQIDGSLDNFKYFYEVKLVEKLVNAVKDGELEAYHVEYDKTAPKFLSERELSSSEIQQRLVDQSKVKWAKKNLPVTTEEEEIDGWGEVDEEDEITVSEITLDTLFNRFSSFELDRTKGIYKGKEINQIHYFNVIVAPSYHKSTWNTSGYLFSIKFTDVQTFLRTRNDIIYSKPAAGLLFNENLLISHFKEIGSEEIDQFVRFCLHHQVPVITEKGTPIDTNIHEGYRQSFRTFGGVIPKREEGDLVSIIIDVNQAYALEETKKQTLTVNWKDVIEAYQQSGVAGKICYFDEAMAKSWFVLYSDNGYVPDTLVQYNKVKISPSSGNGIVFPVPETATCLVDETIFLWTPENKHLSIEGEISFNAQLLYYINNGKLLPKYTNQKGEEELVNFPQLYEKFHTVDYGSRGDPDEMKCDFGHEEEMDTENEIVEDVHYNPIDSALHTLSLTYSVPFQQKENLGKAMPSRVNITLDRTNLANRIGITVYLCYVSWEEVKALFLKENNKWKPIIDNIEKRNFESYWYGTSFN